MKTTHVLGFLASFFWARALLLGWEEIQGVRRQQVPEFSNAGQIEQYLWFPAITLALIVALWAVCLRWNRVKIAVNTFMVFALLSFPIYMLFFTGGI